MSGARAKPNFRNACLWSNGRYKFVVNIVTVLGRRYRRKDRQNHGQTPQALERIVLFCSLAVFDPRAGHTMDVLSPFVPVLCHSDWLFHGESCPRLDVVHPRRAWPSSSACTWHCSLHYLFLQATPLGTQSILYYSLTAGSGKIFPIAQTNVYACSDSFARNATLDTAVTLLHYLSHLLSG